MSATAQRPVSWRRDPRGGLLVVVLGVVLVSFVLLTVAVFAAPWFVRLDARVSADIRAVNIPWLAATARLLSALGDFWPMTLVTAFTVLALLIRGRRPEALLVAVSVAVVAIGGDGLRLLIGRARPAAEYARTVQPGPYGFPSVHALVGFVYFGILGFVTLIGPGRLKRAIGMMVLFAVLAALIGLAPVYLGAQYLGDTIAGWLLGGAWTTLMILLGATWGASSGTNAA